MPSLYGILDARDLAKSVSQIKETGLAEAIRYYLDLYNNAMVQLIGDYAERTTLYQERFCLPTDNGELELSDEYDRGLMKRPSTPTYFDVAYPIKQWSDRLGWTQLFLTKATGDIIQRDFDAAQQRDRNTMMKEILRALLYSANFTFADDEWGNLAVKRLYNADGTVPPPVGTKTFDGTHTHYLGTNGAFNAAFLAVVYEHLREHGNGTNVVLEIARNLETTVSGFTGFVEVRQAQDPNIVYAAGTEPTYARASNARAIGRIANMEVRVHDFFPDNYGFSTDLAQPAPLAFREDPETELNGFKMVQDNPDDNYPLRNAFFRRRGGFGTRNRGNGVCFFVNGTANYTDPAI